jgi:hypothetical protein
MARSNKSSGNSSANIGFEQKLWLAADKLRSNMDAAEYKHVVLRLIFLKYRVQLLKDFADLMLLKLEADSTTRLLTVAGNLMLSTGVKQLTVASHPQLLLTSGQGQA